MANQEVQLWTIQRHDVWKRAQEVGALRANGHKIDRRSKNDLPALRWMVEQMKERIPGYRGPFPTFAKTTKPDLTEKQADPGVTQVQIGFVADAAKVLLSHEPLWQTSVLLGVYAALNEAEDFAYNGELDPYVNPVWGRTETEPEHAAIIMGSWQRIFDLDLIAAHEDWCGPANQVQATIGQVTLAQVTDVKHFTPS